MTTHPLPDLIFMDIQLGDGDCFAIFKTIKIECSIIFCTAYDEYALTAIKINGIDYILKAFAEEELLQVLDKLKQFFQYNHITALESTLKSLQLNEGKRSFVVLKNNT